MGRCFVESQPSKALCWAEDDRDEHNSVVAGHHRTGHFNIRAAGEEEVQTVSHIVFNTGQGVKFGKETRVVLLLNTEVFLFPTGANTDAGVEIDHLAVANHTNVELDRLEYTEDGELLQERAEQFCTYFAGI